ncbi:SRPBCC family protein [Spongisporangium articulatum]|uniref:SRPBCC family protein n=1 Tax=Spongisporangium articulatum TaxID=3362603 RepID=A0ABW8AR32_9ACTN
MQLTHRFHVPSDLDETWAHFQDVAGLAGCFPGAQVLSVDGDDFTGSCKVKLGPIALVYTGTGRFTERDPGARRLVVEAKGKDKRGNGTAAATATLTMGPAGGGGTDVEVLTDLAITGKPAQFGRGLIQDVSDKLLGQFVDCLEQQLAPAPPEPAPAEPTGPAPSGELPAPASSSEPSGPADAPPLRPSRPAPQQAEALDLGAAVLPALARAYWKPAAIGTVALALIIWVWRR